MDRNPSPPPEIINNADFFPDKVGDTVYSKMWIYKTLMAIIENCEKPLDDKISSEGSIMENSNSTEESCQEPENKNEVVELDQNIEEIACILWDMSADKDVAEFLISANFLNSLLDVIDKTKSPRLLEIVLGVLGNLSSFDSICEDISKNADLLHSIVMLTGTSDTPTLVQVLRVILCGVLYKESLCEWIIVLKENSTFMENTKFILENCLNDEVLKLVFHILYIVLQEEGSFFESWGGDTNIRILIEAGKQLRAKQVFLDNFLCVFYILRQYPPSQASIDGMFPELLSFFDTFFLSLRENFRDQPPVTVVNACYELYNDMLESDNTEKESYKIGSRVLKAILNTYDIIVTSLSRLLPMDPGVRSWKSLQNTLLHTLDIVKLYVKKESDIEMVDTVLRNSELNGKNNIS